MLLQKKKVLSLALWYFFHSSKLLKLFLPYNVSRQTNKATAVTHYNFKRELSYQLFMPIVRIISQLTSLRRSVRRAMTLLGVSSSPQFIPRLSQKRSRCKHLSPQAAIRTKKWYWHVPIVYVTYVTIIDTFYAVIAGMKVEKVIVIFI